MFHQNIRINFEMIFYESQLFRSLLQYKKNCLESKTKLTCPRVNFINVLRTNFLYKHRFSSQILALSKNLCEKFAHLRLMKLTATLVDILETDILHPRKCGSWLIFRALKQIVHCFLFLKKIFGTCQLQRSRNISPTHPIFGNFRN